MAAWLLGGPGSEWTIERINDIIASGERKVVVLEKPVAVHILYRTAVVDPDDNSISFFEDIYGRDRLISKALFGTKK